MTGHGRLLLDVVGHGLPRGENPLAETGKSGKGDAVASRIAPGKEQRPLPFLPGEAPKSCQSGCHRPATAFSVTF